ncbi:hypothetical protein CLI92_09695 [Vandammella animalimorsus]|uniref:Uncharacterized protein n=1 Tax=Vandammella animalimorsus TaxID=2029117 RepID=A0A2A2T4C8_9BURK|nr:hypothetical protein CLI92_09695 [Vandammella animalimorsus]PAX19746.1 hypothetical protein CLI93_06375 [Vandammella animalimorsus]
MGTAISLVKVDLLLKRIEQNRISLLDAMAAILAVYPSLERVSLEMVHKYSEPLPSTTVILRQEDLLMTKGQINVLVC